jgi:phosphopantetheinyl transferase (holo-ACP synthase)
MPGVHLSITHSDGVAIATAARAPIGIDLTPVELRPRPFDDEAFLDHELDDWLRLLGASAPERLRSIAFAAKEAALKWLGTGLRAALHDVRVTPTMLGTAEPCADLRAPVRRVEAELHVRESASPGGDSRRRTRTLHGVVSDLGAQAFVGFAEQPWELAPPSREAGEDREPRASK